MSRRRSERLLLTFPIRVQGTSAKGQAFSENTRTLVVNRHGARIQLKQPVVAGQTMRIMNLVGSAEAEFRVVGLTQPLTDQGGEWGVECRDEKRNIWGIEFPPLDEKATDCSVVLECRRCHQVGLTPISLVEYDVLESSGLLSKECKSCEKTTSWGYSQNQVGVPAPGQVSEPSINEVLEVPAPKGERRTSPRAALRLPIRVRNWYGVEEITKSENISKGGIAFISDKHYEIGEALQVTCPYNPGGHNIELRSRVVRRGESGGRFIYGIRYEKET